jgi:hypothetical protein
MRDIRDLVERLRKHDESAQVLTAQQPPFSIFGEAADEIERLRALWIGADDSPPEAPREGWKTVHHIPTSAMFDAGFAAHSKQYAGEPLDDAVAKVHAIWQAMVDAAPGRSPREPSRSK